MAAVNHAPAGGKGTKRKATTILHEADYTTRTPTSKRKGSTRKSAAEAESVNATEAASSESADGSQSALSLPLIKRFEREALAGKQNINHITTLLAHVEQQRNSHALSAASSAPTSTASLHTTTAAYQSLYRILEHYAEAGELSLSLASGASGAGGASASLAGQLRSWLHSHYSRYVACSLSFLTHSHYTPLQLSALHALMSIVRLSAASLPPDAAASLLSTGLYASLVRASLASPHYVNLYDTLTGQYLLPYADLRLAALRAIKANITHIALHRNSSSGSTTADTTNTHTDRASEATLPNSLTLLLQLSSPDTPSPTSSFTNATLASSALRSSLSAAFMAFLSVRHTPATYKRVLEHIDSHLLPNVTNPLLLADFLTDSYNIGGIVSLLSLASLFHLISRYNLDYPHFYHKLYSLCTPALTTSKHRTKLFVLLSKFLSSAYLPSSLVAAFCKRLARLAIAGGCGVDGSVELMRLVWGLVRRNRSVSGMVWGQQEAERDKEGAMDSLTDFLLRRQAELADESDKRKENTSEADSSGGSGQLDDIFDDNLSDVDELDTPLTGVKSGSGRTDPLTAIQSQSSSLSPAVSTNIISTSASSFTADPFLPLVDDPAACEATASTLWELRTLTCHYAPAVRTLAALFYAANAPKGELDAVGVGRVGESEGYEGMIRKEMDRRKNQKVAVNYGKRATLFEEADIVSSNFTWS